MRMQHALTIAAEPATLRPHRVTRTIRVEMRNPDGSTMSRQEETSWARYRWRVAGAR